MRKIVSFTTHPDYLAVEKNYMAFLTLERQLIIQKIISDFNLTEQQAEDFFTSLAEQACSQLEGMSLAEVNKIIELNNVPQEVRNELAANN